MDSLKTLIQKAERENNTNILKAKRMSLEQEIRNAFKKIEEVKKAEQRFKKEVLK